MSFTYLFGAGASANVLPVVKNMTDDMEKIFEVVRLFTEGNPRENNEEEQKKLNAINSILKEFERLLKQIKSHTTIDTLARKLYLTQEETDLKSLKTILDFYLTIAQIIYGADKRYDVFFATLLKPGEKIWAELPKNIQILSWNYDFQFELAASRFYNEGNLETLQEHLNVYPRSGMEKTDNNKFKIVKLNGGAGGFTIQPNEGYYQTHLEHLDLRTVEDFKHISKDVNEYYSIKKEPIRNEVDVSGVLHYSKQILQLNLNDLISTQALINQDYLTYGNTFIGYSWDNNDMSKLIKEYSIEICINTIYLIVIGYSFPTFNRDVDRLLLEKMINLKKVIIQTKLETANDVKERVLALMPQHRTTGENKIEIEVRTSTDEFFIPYEYR